MKITLDKKVITMEEAHAAREMMEDYKSWLEKSDIENAARAAINTAIKSLNFYGNSFSLLTVDTLQISKDHNELCLWAEVMMRSHNEIAEVHFNLSDAINTPYGDSVHSYTQFYCLNKAASGCF